MSRLAGGVTGAVALCVLMSVGATASTSTWTVVPGGPASSAGSVVVTVQETGVEFQCSSVSGSGVSVSGNGNANPIAEIRADDVSFAECEGPFGAVAELTPRGVWHLAAAAYDPATGVSSGTIEDIEIGILAPGCTATLSGYVDITYDNATDTVTLLPNPTVEISYVDPVDTCLALIEQGQHLMPDASFILGPGQDISSP